VAALLGSISPAHVFYSQEVRMYAFLPALYALLLALVLRGRVGQGRLWLGLTLGALLALYLHLFAAFFVLALYLLLAWRLWRDGGLATFWRHWLGSAALVVAGFAPWLYLFWRWGGDVPANLQPTTMGAAGPSAIILSYLALVWDFLQTGLTGLPAAAKWPAQLLALGLVLALLWLARRSGERQKLVAVVAALVVPLLAAAGIWLFSPLSHPRYLLFLLAPLLLLLARVLVLFGREQAGAVRPAILRLPLAALALFLLLALAVNHAIAFRLARHPDYQRFDMRALAAAIGERAAPGDVALMPPLDRSLWYYPPAPAQAVNWDYAGGDPAAQRQALAETLAGYKTVYFVRYHGLYDYDPQSQIPFLLEWNGSLRERFTVDRMDVHGYTLEGAWRPPQLEDAAAFCGSLRLTGLAYEKETRPAGALAATLRWQLAGAGQNVVVSLRLHEMASQEERLASADVPLLSAAGEPASRWQPGMVVDNFYTLPVPLGAIPGAYRLTALVRLEDGTLLCEPLALGNARVLPTAGQQQDPYGSWDVSWVAPEREDVAPGLRLEGYAVDPGSLRPGQLFTVVLRWRAVGGNLPAYQPRLQLRQGNTVLASSEGELFRRYPSDRWQADELLVERRTLAMPATLAPLQLAIDGDGPVTPLGTVAVDREALLWDLPGGAAPSCARFAGVGSLVGYQWAPPQLTLYWEGAATAPAASSYTAFVHLVDESGALLGQDDGLPAGGERPTDSWLPGEVIADRHELPLVPAAAGLRVGLDDLATGDRVPALGCDGQPLPDDALLLPLP
jgi:hypothetical protein